MANASKNFAQNLQTTNLGVKFSKALFTDPGSLSASTILSGLKALGLQIPAGVQTGVEVAQILVAGQALYTQSVNGADLAQTIPTSVSIIKNLSAIANANGFLDTNTMQSVDVGADVAMIMASGGASVTSYIALALDLANVCASKQNQADVQAAQNLQSQYNSTILPGIQAAANTFADFQSGKIGIYGLITEVAVSSPYQWPQLIQQNTTIAQMFPMLKMIPDINQKITGYGESKIWGEWPWGDKWVISDFTSTKSLDVTRIGVGGSKDELINFFYTFMIQPWTYLYRLADQAMKNGNHASLKETALLSLLVSQDGQISDTFDYAGFIIGSRLTPWDLNENDLVAQLTGLADQIDQADLIQAYHESGVASNYQNPALQDIYNQKMALSSKVQELHAANSIDDLANDPDFRAGLSKFFQFPQMEFEKNPGDFGMTGATTPSNWRSLHNYIAVIHMVETFKTDPYFKDSKFLAGLDPELPSVAELEDSFRKYQFLTVSRNINFMTKQNIAKILGVSVSNLVQVSPTVWKGN